MQNRLPAMMVLAAALTALLLLAACGNGERPRIVVAAASDLRFVFEELGPLYEERCNCDVVFSFGSSGLISTQIAQGLRVDVFASADRGFVETLARRGLLVDESIQPYAIGRIVLAVPVRSEVGAVTLEDLTGAEFGTIAIANPQHAPYGRAAQEALESVGAWDQVRPRLVLGENASLATQYVETGNADAGIVPLSLAIARADFLRYVLIDEARHAPLEQVAAVVRGSRQQSLAQGFLDFINGPEGRPLMRDYGFLLPGEARRR